MDMSKAPAPHGSPWRNLRPELAAGNREHRAYKINERQYENMRQMLGSLDAMHRLAFVTAASVRDALFIDVRQSQEPVPFPEHGDLFCAIVGDREIESVGVGRRNVATATRIEDTNVVPDGRGNFLAVPIGTRIISRGPSWFHQTSLISLFAQARYVMVDVTGVGLAPVYLAACAPVVERYKSAILVESSPDFMPQWLHFVNEHTTDCQYKLMKNIEEFETFHTN